MSENKNKAITKDERRIIETGIRNGSTKTAIARTIGKDKSTIGKEIRLHRKLKHRCGLPRECDAYRKCVHGRECTDDCPDFIPFHCSRRDRSPGACNGCSLNSKCRFDKFIYDADLADREYHTNLVDSRLGVNLTISEAKEMAAVIGPLLKNGLSPYQILAAHPELGISEKTLYNYINQQVFYVAGIEDIDLRRKVSRKISHKVTKNYKKREDRSYLNGRLYSDFQAYCSEHPQANIMEMDTVYNDVTNGPFIQTFKFLPFGFLFAIYHDKKTAAEMTDGLSKVEDALGEKLFNTWAEVTLTDRGTEFSDPSGMEKRTGGSVRTRVFYCDPMQSGQKGSLEVHHEQLRYILPKGTDLRGLGLTGQEALNLALSHINSSPLESLHGKCPIEYAKFLCIDFWEKMESFGIKQIPPDQLILKPYLLKGFLK